MLIIKETWDGYMQLYNIFLNRVYVNYLLKSLYILNYSNVNLKQIEKTFLNVYLDQHAGSYKSLYESEIYVSVPLPLPVQKVIL